MLSFCLLQLPPFTDIQQLPFLSTLIFAILTVFDGLSCSLLLFKSHLQPQILNCCSAFLFLLACLQILQGVALRGASILTAWILKYHYQNFDSTENQWLLTPLGVRYSIFPLLQPLPSPFIFHIALNSIKMSTTTFFFLMLWIGWHRVYCKDEFHTGNIQQLSLAFSHCLCGCWCKGINLWPHQILAWMIVVHLFKQYRSWSAQQFFSS